MIKIAFAFLLVFTSLASAQERTPWDIEDVRRGLIEIGTAYTISEECPQASARKIKGVAALWGLANKAQRAGFSRAQIESFIDSDAHKDRLEKIVWARLVQHGATRTNPQSVCRAAQTEKSMNTLASTYFSL